MSAADILRGKLPWSNLRGAMLSVNPASDKPTVLTIALVPIDLSIRLTETSVWMPQSKACVLIEGPRAASNIDCLVEIVEEKEIREERKQKTGI